MKGVILAAGKGTRLYPVTKVIPKPLLPIANRMTIVYAFDQLKDCGIADVCIVVGENGEKLREALGNGDAFGIRLSYVTQTDPHGLAHAVGFAKEFVGDDSFVLYLGDAIYDQSLAPHVQRFKEAGCANLNLVKPVPDPRRFGVASVVGERIVRLVEKPERPDSNLAMAGMYVFGPEIWGVLPDLAPSARGEYEITDAIQMLVDRGKIVLAGVYEGNWFDTGTLDSFLDTTLFLTGGATVIGDGAKVEGPIGNGAVIGEGSFVSTDLGIEQSVILPGTRLECKGPVWRSLVGGEVRRFDAVSERVLYGDLE